MATGRSGAVAALVAGVDNPHAAALVKGICRVAMAEGFDVLFVDTLHGASPQHELERVMGMQVDGLLIAAPLPLAASELLARYGRPFVDVLRRRLIGAGGTQGTSAQEAAGALVGRYLQHMGHRRITFVACDADGASAERLRGLDHALAAAALPITVHQAPSPDAAGGAAVASSVLLAGDRPDAVVACNDQVAMGLLSEARLLGVSIPEDVSVVGIENTPFAAYMSPALTSVDLHADVLGAHAMTELLTAIRGQAAMPPMQAPAPRLVVRNSTRLRSS